jgi:phosphoglucosamine mutase
LTKLFGSSGIRGLANVDLTPTLASKIGLAIGTLSKARKVLVARDTRVSGQMLENALISGLVATGAKVSCLGVVPTPALAFLTKKLKADVAVMITASHNPPQYNGIKIFNRDSVAYDEKKQDKIEEIIKHNRFRLANWRNIGESSPANQDRLYSETVQKTVKLHRKWKVLVDPGCGATYSLAPIVLKAVGCEVAAINAQPDGFFPARSSEPNAESLKPLASVVRKLGVDGGFAFDGDGDRVAFIDEKGDFVDFDRALAAYAAYVVKRRGGGVVATNVEASMCVEKMVEKQGGKVVRTRVGDVYVSEAIGKYGAIFGGEPCGAWIHPQVHYCPDGILSSVLLLKALEDEDKKLSEFTAETPKYPTLRTNVPCKNEAKHRIVEKTSEELKRTFPKFKEVSDVDGVRLTVRNGWVLVRESGTEPLIRLTVEGESLEAAKEIMNKTTELVKKVVAEVRK